MGLRNFCTGLEPLRSHLEVWLSDQSTCKVRPSSVYSKICHRESIIKPYVQDGIYHLYNRGVEKRTIFLDHKDYTVFLRILKDALSLPIDTIDTAHILQGETLEGLYNFLEKKAKEFLFYCETLLFLSCTKSHPSPGETSRTSSYQRIYAVHSYALQHVF